VLTHASTTPCSRIWCLKDSFAYGFRQSYHPWHLYPEQQVGPFVGGAGYLFAIFVQRKAPQFFALAYFAAVASVVVPAAYLILS
jgi:hypothetical protein